MKSRKKRLGKSRLCLIIDKKVLRRKKLFDLNIDILQYRDKSIKKEDILNNAFKIKRLLSRAKTIFIVNDHADIARICGADGVHLGQNDISVKAGRKIIGKDRLIGVSCQSLKQAVEAQNNGADYIGFGPVFSTPTKPGHKPVGIKALRSLKGKVKIPVFAIGGIDLSNLSKITGCGIKRVAVIRAILHSKKPGITVKKFREELN